MPLRPDLIHESSDIPDATMASSWHCNWVFINAPRSPRNRTPRQKVPTMGKLYLLMSLGHEGPVPVGLVYRTAAEADEAAAELNTLLPGLRARRIDIDTDNMAAESTAIQRHVRRFSPPQLGSGNSPFQTQPH
jgi:hypothetical protein